MEGLQVQVQLDTESVCVGLPQLRPAIQRGGFQIQEQVACLTSNPLQLCVCVCVYLELFAIRKPAEIL